MLYRQKQIEIEAFRLTKDVDMNAPKWFMDAVDKDKIFIDRILVDGSTSVYGCSIENAGTWQKAKIGDYIVRGTTGNIFACSEGAFCKTYEHLDGKEVEPMKHRSNSRKKGRCK